MMNSNSGGGINVPEDYDQVINFKPLIFVNRIINSSINKNYSLLSAWQSSKRLLRAHVRREVSINMLFSRCKN